MEYAAYAPSTDIAFRHLGGPFMGHVNYDLTLVGKGTSLNVQVEFQLPWYMRPFQLLIKPMVNRQVGQNLASLTRLVDSE